MASKMHNSKTRFASVNAPARVLGVALVLLAGTTGALAQGTPDSLPTYEQAPQDAAPVQDLMQDVTAPAPADVPPAPAASKPTTAKAVPASTQTAGPLSGESVRVDDNMTVDLHVKDEDLANVLEMLSIQSQKNIIASKDISARVTANLYGVTFYEALDAILNVNGYGFIEEGNFIKIYTIEELQKITEQQRQKISKVIMLNYLASVDAAEFVKPLLSPEGQIKVNSKATNFGSMGEVPIGAEDYANNSMLVVYDFEENVAQVEEMLRQIDTRPAQVLVEATILQTQLNEANALGVDFSVVADMSFNQIPNPLAAATSLLAAPSTTNSAPVDRGGSAVTSSVGNVGSGSGGLKVGILSNDIGVFVRALDEVTDTTVLSNPKIMTLNRQSSRVLVGRKVGYLNTTSTDTSTTQSVEFLDTGTSLHVRPFVTNDGMIRLELKPKVAEAAIRQINDVSGAAVTIPDEITNELTTNILVRDGQTVVMGGLFRENVTATRKQVPLLGDIPIIGQAFRGNDDSTNRNEIIFLVTPTIVDDNTSEDAGRRAAQYVDQIVSGAREGTLFWSRDRLTDNLNIEADRLFREGQTDEALNKINRSLRLNPQQPELINLREQITGQKTPTTNRSFLDRVFDSKAAGSLLKVQADELNVSSNSLDSLPTYDNVPAPSVNAEAEAQYDYMMPQLPASSVVARTSGAQQPAGNTQDFQVEVSSQGWNDDALAAQDFEAGPLHADQFSPSTNLTNAGPSNQLIQNYFLNNPQPRWFGPSGFVSNISAWYQFMQQQNSASTEAVTTVDPSGQ